MVDKKISELDAYTSPIVTDVIPVVDTTNGITKKIDAGYMLNSSMARQAVINGNFDIWQRGTTYTHSAGTTLAHTYTGADRWLHYFDPDSGTLPTLVFSRQLLTSGDISNAFYHYRVAPNGAGTSLGNGSLGEVVQRIEHGTRMLAGNGKKVTISFYARSSIANKKIGISLEQNYGTGGAPSSTEIITGTTWTLTSSWVKYTYTFTTNTLAGKTFGTVNDDYLQLNFGVQWGSTNGTTFGYGSAETYVGSGNIDIAQVQLCAGDVALPFEPKSFNQELLDCQRYYEKSFDYTVAPAVNSFTGAVNFRASAADQTDRITVKFCVAKRATNPTITIYGGSATGKVAIVAVGDKSVSYALNGNSGFVVYPTENLTAGGNTQFSWTADAEL